MNYKYIQLTNTNMFSNLTFKPNSVHLYFDSSKSTFLFVIFTNNKELKDF